MFNRFRKKTVYFVRHGQTVLNAARIRQGAEGGLTELGRKQVETQAKRLENLPIGVMLVSPFERARETADIINASLQKKIEYIDLLAERRNPHEIIGKSYDDAEVKKIVDQIDKSFHPGALRFSDEENFEDLRDRARQLLDFLSRRSERTILCVTHGIFLTMVIAYMQYGDSLTAEQFVALQFFNPSNNAAVSVCEYSPWASRNEHWSLVDWDDQATVAKTYF